MPGDLRHISNTRSRKIHPGDRMHPPPSTPPLSPGQDFPPCRCSYSPIHSDKHDPVPSSMNVDYEFYPEENEFCSNNLDHRHTDRKCYVLTDGCENRKGDDHDNQKQDDYDNQTHDGDNQKQNHHCNRKRNYHDNQKQDDCDNQVHDRDNQKQDYHDNQKRNYHSSRKRNYRDKQKQEYHNNEKHHHDNQKHHHDNRKQDDGDNRADDKEGKDKGGEGGRGGGVGWVLVVVMWGAMTWARVQYVRNPVNWWLLHPDENFQSLEVAHTVAYGYGFRPYEFSSLPETHVHGAADNVSLYRQRELELGMYGMRSALYPLFYVMVSCVVTVFRFDVRPFVLWKVAHTVVSALLPLSVFRFTRKYFVSHDAACLAAILVSLSAHLNVLGTHPLLNSFLSPAVFWSLAGLLPLVRGSEVADRQTWRASTEVWDGGQPSHHNEHRFCPPWMPTHLSHLKQLLRPWKEADRPTKLAGTKPRHGNNAECGNEWPESNGFTSSHKAATCCGETQQCFSQYFRARTRMHQKDQRGPLSHHPDRQKVHSVETSMVTSCGDVLNALGNFSRQIVSVAEFVHGAHGFVLALCMYMRVDLVLFSVLVLLPVFRPARARYDQLLVSGVGFLAGVGLGILEDFFFYNATVLSPVNWFRFNIVEGLSGELFGKSSPWTYVVSLSANNVTLPCLGLLHVAALVCLVILSMCELVRKGRGQYEHCDRDTNGRVGSPASDCISSTDSCSGKSRDKKKGVKRGGSRKMMKTSILKTNVKNGSDFQNANSWKLTFRANGTVSNGTKNSMLSHSQPSDNADLHHCTNQANSQPASPAVTSSSTATLTLSWVLLILFYSCSGHKELRFIHNTLVLMLITSASLVTTAKWLLQNVLSTVFIKGLLGLLLLLLASDQWTCFPGSSSASIQTWAYQRTSNSRDVNACLAYLADHDDVTGVFIDSPFHVTGGYNLLRHDVPLFTLLVKEFVEFDVSMKVTSHQKSVLDRSHNVSYVTLDRLSNFVAVQNAGYLVKLLIHNRHYNYLILTQDRKFLPTGYQQAFAHGTMRVMKRTFDPHQERQLQTLAEHLADGVDATVLKYEGDVLFRFHRFQLALQRYLTALHLNPAHAHIFQAIAACYLKLGHVTEAKQWSDACVQQFGLKDCSKPLSTAHLGGM